MIKKTKLSKIHLIDLLAGKNKFGRRCLFRNRKSILQKNKVDSGSYMDAIEEKETSEGSILELESNNFYSQFGNVGKPAGREIMFNPETEAYISKRTREKYKELLLEHPKLTKKLFNLTDENDKTFDPEFNKLFNSNINPDEFQIKFNEIVKRKEIWKKENRYPEALLKAYIILRAKGVDRGTMKG